MKLISVLLAFSIVCPFVASAQYSAKSITVTSLPVPEMTAPTTPQWKQEQDQVNGRISNSKLAKMKHVTGAIIAFFQDSCLSEGSYSPVWHGEYFSDKTSPGPIAKFGVECNFPDQKTQLTITANDISPLLNHLVVNGQDFLTMKPVIAVKNDCPYFEYAHSKTWLIAADNRKLPYTPVTRKEYLQEARREVTIIKNSITDYITKTTPVRPAAVQEADKKAAIDQLTAVYSGIDLQVRMKQLLKNYQTDEEYLKEHMEKGTAGMDSTLHLMDSLLSNPKANELDKPAIVSVVAADFQGFEDGHSDKMLIRMNAAYFNPYFSGETPQFFLVTLQSDASSATSVDIEKQLLEKFNSQILKNLLGK